MRKETKTRIATTLSELRKITAARQPSNGNEIEADVVFHGTLTFTIPDLLNEGSDGPMSVEKTAVSPEQPERAEDEMSDKTHYVCQTYALRDVGKGRATRKVLERKAVVECLNASEAEERARKLHSKVGCVGVDAFAVTVDEELGDYGEPAFLLRLGEVPPLDL